MTVLLLQLLVILAYQTILLINKKIKMQQKLQNTKNLVSDVFNKVYDKYDLMNNLMSFGVHKSWKKQLIYSMNPKPNKKLIDVACGTGDIANFSRCNK